MDDPTFKAQIASEIKAKEDAAAAVKAAEVAKIKAVK